MSTTEPRKHFNEADPHGFGAATHGAHHVTSIVTLLAVLAVLLVFTVLTVVLSLSERTIAHAFDVEIPQWVNIFVVMSIATVKGALVVLYFMHLKYDNKLNAIILGTCIVILGLFVGFTMLDLGNRDSMYDFEKESYVPGGTQVGFVSKPSDFELSRNNVAMIEFAKQRNIRQWGLEAWLEYHMDGKTITERDVKHPVKWYEAQLALKADSKPNRLAEIDWAAIDAEGKKIWDHEYALHHASHDGEHDAHASSEERSRPRAGLTEGLYAEKTETTHSPDGHTGANDAGQH